MVESAVERFFSLLFLKVITKHVHHGTHIVTDCWAGYARLNQLGYTHTKVNHSRFYVDPETGMHTNTIKGKWNGVKVTVPKQAYRTPYVLQTYLGAVMWRTKYKRDLWKALLDALRCDSEWKLLHPGVPYMPFMYCRPT